MQHLFAFRCCRAKISSHPTTCSLEGKNAANQAGLERKSYLRRSDENEVANYDVVNDLEDNQNADVDED